MIANERTAGRRASGELDWLLDDLVARVGEIRHAVVLSGDGLAVGASSALSREDAEHLAAVASGFHSLAKGATAISGPGTYGRPWSRWTRAFCSWRRRARDRAWQC